MPPVAITRMPAACAAQTVAATVVEPAPPPARQAARFDRFSLGTSGVAASRSTSDADRPTRTVPSSTPIVAGHGAGGAHVLLEHRRDAHAVGVGQAVRDERRLQRDDGRAGRERRRDLGRDLETRDGRHGAHQARSRRAASTGVAASSARAPQPSIAKLALTSARSSARGASSPCSRPATKPAANASPAPVGSATVVRARRPRAQRVRRHVVQPAAARAALPEDVAQATAREPAQRGQRVVLAPEVELLAAQPEDVGACDHRPPGVERVRRQRVVRVDGHDARRVRELRDERALDLERHGREVERSGAAPGGGHAARATPRRASARPGGG